MHAPIRLDGTVTGPQRRPPDISGGTDRSMRAKPAPMPPQRRPPDISGGTGEPFVGALDQVAPSTKAPRYLGGTLGSLPARLVCRSLNEGPPISRGERDGGLPLTLLG